MVFGRNRRDRRLCHFSEAGADGASSCFRHDHVFWAARRVAISFSALCIITTISPIADADTLCRRLRACFAIVFGAAGSAYVESSIADEGAHFLAIGISLRRHHLYFMANASAYFDFCAVCRRTIRQGGCIGATPVNTLILWAISNRGAPSFTIAGIRRVEASFRRNRTPPQAVSVQAESATPDASRFRR